MRRVSVFAGILAVFLMSWNGVEPAQAQAPGMVRVAHMAPGAPAVDVALDGQVVLRALAFGQVSGYAAVPAGTRQARVTPAGAREPVVIDAPLTIESGRAYTVVAVGELPSITPIVLTDDLTPPPNGQTKVRFVHSAPDAPAVDVAVVGGSTLFSNIAFRNASMTATVPAGTYTLEVRPAGQQSVTLSVPNVTLTAGDIVTVFAAGKLSDGSLRAVVATYRPGLAMPTTGTSVAHESTSVLPLGVLVVIATLTLGSIACLRLRATAAVPVRLPTPQRDDTVDRHDEHLRTGCL
jgi:hypothetical protein